MRGLIILAISIFLVGVQASGSSTYHKELEDVDDTKTVELLRMMGESCAGGDVKYCAAADETSKTLSVLDKFHKMETVDDVLSFLQNYKDVTNCTSNTCQFCALSACIQLTFIEQAKEFKICLSFRGKNLYCKTVPAKNFKYCMTILLIVKICAEIKNVKINDGKACMDVGVCVSGICQDFPSKCLGTSN